MFLFLKFHICPQVYILIGIIINYFFPDIIVYCTKNENASMQMVASLSHNASFNFTVQHIIVSINSRKYPLSHHPPHSQVPYLPFYPFAGQFMYIDSAITGT